MHTIYCYNEIITTLKSQIHSKQAQRKAEREGCPPFHKHTYTQKHTHVRAHTAARVQVGYQRETRLGLSTSTHASGAFFGLINQIELNSFKRLLDADLSSFVPITYFLNFNCYAFRETSKCFNVNRPIYENTKFQRLCAQLQAYMSLNNY